jgi:hypothetical protein
MVMWLLRRYSGMTLKTIGQAMGGMDYGAVSERIRRFQRQVETDSKLRTLLQQATGMLNLGSVEKPLFSTSAGAPGRPLRSATLSLGIPRLSIKFTSAIMLGP